MRRITGRRVAIVSVAIVRAFLAFTVLILAGCGPKLQTRTIMWPDGKRAREYHYYEKSSSDWSEVMHGTDTVYNRDGTTFSRGEWRDGKPWSGVIRKNPVGSAGGNVKYARYENGREIEEVTPPQSYIPHVPRAFPEQFPAAHLCVA